MAVAGWILDKSAAARAGEQDVARELEELAGALYICLVGELEQLYSARSAKDYDRLKFELHESFDVVPAPPEVLDRALALQQDLACYHGMWHRTPIPDLLIAETALHHGLGVVHVDRDYERISQVRPLVVRGLGSSAGRSRWRVRGSTKVASGGYLGLMRAVGLKVLKNRLSEYVRMAAAGETIMVTDRDRVVAELGPPKQGRSPVAADAFLAEAVRKGWVTVPQMIHEGPPPRRPVAPLESLLGELEADRADR